MVSLAAAHFKLKQYKSALENLELAFSISDENGVEPENEWLELAQSFSAMVGHRLNTENTAPDIYVNELKFFEVSDLDESAWAKHIVEAESDTEKAKWTYIEERVSTAHQRKHQ